MPKRTTGEGEAGAAIMLERRRSPMGDGRGEGYGDEAEGAVEVLKGNS